MWDADDNNVKYCMLAMSADGPGKERRSARAGQSERSAKAKLTRKRQNLCDNDEA